MKKILNYGLLLLVMLFTMASNIFADNQYGLKDKIQDGVILHCFDWKVSDIKAEIPNIAKAGFTAVQTSPVHQKEGLGSAWYMPYQPYDYVIGNGICPSAADLKALCDEAHKYGVKVIVDVVANHTNGDLKWVADRLKDKSLYHDYQGGADDNNRYSITHAKIGMWDLKTEDSRVQAIIKEYIQSLKACGVDGIRWDAVKHIGLPSEGDSFMQNVVDQTMYNYGEILNTPGPNAAELYKEYTKYMSVTDNKYGNGVSQTFHAGGTPSSIGNLSVAQNGSINPAKLVYWGESHDTYSNNPPDESWSKYCEQNEIDRSYAIMAGNNAATSLYFSRPSAKDKNAIKLGAKGSTHFTSAEVAEVNHMHNACAGEPNYCVHTDKVIAQIRKTGAVIVLGGHNTNQPVSIANGAGDGKWLAAGTYTDKVGGGTFTVTNATISGQVGSTGIAVLYSSTPTPPTPPDPVEVYEPVLENANEVSCFLETSCSNATIWPWNDATQDNFATNTWPGDAMTLVGKAANGNNIFKWTYTGSKGIPTNVIFCHDGEKFSGVNGESDKGIKFVNHGYCVDGQASSKTITKVKDDNPTPTGEYVYFDNAQKWENVYCYFYNGTTSSTVWPGVKMTYDSSASHDGKTGWYKVEIPSSYLNAKFFINDGTAGTAISGANATTTKVVNNGVGNDNGGDDNGGNGGGGDDNGGYIPPTPNPQNLDAQYKTNPNGAGIKKTIKVDGDISDWNANMIIAQGAANDDPRVYRPNSMYECPMDLYTLYGCYDDTNLYLMWEMTNVQDVVAPNDQDPLSNGTLFNGHNLPMFIAINTNNSSTWIGNDCKTPTGSTLWDKPITYTGKVNKIVAFSTDGSNGPFIYGGNSTGINVKEECSHDDTGITMKWGQGILSSTVKGIDGAYGTNHGRVPGDMTKGTATYVDFNTKGHNSSKLDFHYEMSIPLAKLGVTANDVASKGLGVMLVATFGLSGMDCLPYDTTMNDKADLDDAAGSQENNSFEKSDDDNITVPFAYIGKLQ